MVEFGGCCCCFKMREETNARASGFQPSSSFRSSPRSALRLIVSQGSPFATSAVIHFLEQTCLIITCRTFTCPVDRDIDTVIFIFAKPVGNTRALDVSLPLLNTPCLHHLNHVCRCLRHLRAVLRYSLRETTLPRSHTTLL